MNIFEYQNQEQQKSKLPLAARIRPSTLNDFAGQEHILGPDKLFRRAIETDKLFSSIILWGPPGIGKTTLANIIAHTTKSQFSSLSAVTAGVADIRQLITQAQQYFSVYNKRTIVLIDEIHRFNKAQQDALLPYVEDGTIILIGATTENPLYEVIPALVSRSRVFNLLPLTKDHIKKIINRALTDPLGYPDKKITIASDALEHIALLSGGDARSALNILELAVETTQENSNHELLIDITIAEEAAQKRTIGYDRTGDEHYNTISAFIKSVRGSDPDAALFWLAKMIYAGEDPKFIMRRLLILASEDIGLADPLGIVVAASCAQALEWCGLPEAQYHLSHATVYLATAPKSNSMCDYFKAKEAVEKTGKTQVPYHLRSAMLKGECLGHKVGYKYPHEFKDHWVKQQYLPDALMGTQFYQPSDQGYEKKIIERLKLWRHTSTSTQEKNNF